MYIGNFAADSYYSVRSYATTAAPTGYKAGSPADKTIKCIRDCPWYNPFCQHGCVAAEGGYQAQVAAGKAAGDIGNTITQGIRDVGSSLGQGLGDVVTQGSPTLIMMGIAALGILAIVMVVR